ncbi:MAG: PQQ-binding-like beta-propeller repeat protein [Gemmatales bacterium]|nr:PQQ-binding-like beta-propeller repeat protein [Gemmatales bacterium]MDW8388337.1 PQQ-binding-like beta-propeller repeat protein [Gemmatales bacterium]
MARRDIPWLSVAVGGLFGWLALAALLIFLTTRTEHAAAQAVKAAPANQPGAAPGAGGQPGQPPGDSSEDTRFTDRVRLPVDRSANRKIERVKEWIQREEWGDAVRLLQSILNSPEDVVLKDEKGRWVSVRYEANRILGEMPANGRQFYELEYGTQARNALKKALNAGDPRALADVALRFLHTEAGAEANQLLATYYLDQGSYIQAALCFERLLTRPGVMDTLPPLVLYKAALAFERTGDVRNRDRAWNELTRKLDRPGEPPLPPSLARLGVNRLRESLALKSPNRSGGSGRDWPMFLGSVDRSAVGEGGAPFLEPRYSVETAFDSKTRNFLEQATRPKNAILSGFYPLTVGDKLLYRSYLGVHCVDLMADSASGPMPIWEYRTDVSLDDLMRSQASYDPTGQTISAWLQNYLSVAPSILYDNTTLGTMSTDGTFLYLIEDLAVPPPPVMMDGRAIIFNREQQGLPSVQLQPWMRHNRLTALDLSKEGKLEWSLPTIRDHESVEAPFTDTFFLGAPLPLGDRLYVLAETNGEIRLLCLDPMNKGAMEWSQPLCAVESRKLAEDPVRRTQAALLAYGEGILVCPTHAGAIIGVDLLTRSLLWAHSYQEMPDNPMPMTQVIVGGRGFRQYSQQPLTPPAWASSVPIIKDSRVVFTAPDADAVHCLNLRDGTLLWKEQRSGDLYLAGVYRGKVLLVGRDFCRALDLDTGKEIWRVQTGMPSGRGTANATTYFLPLKAGEVWAVEIDTGKVLARSRSPRNEVPGNLVFHEGDVVSQSVNRLTVYPQLSVRERTITERLAKNPKDPRGLLDRGELRLHQGSLRPAVEDLRTALDGALPPELVTKARTKLYEAMAELLEQDFAANEDLLKEFEALVTSWSDAGLSEEDRQAHERELRDRKARLLRLVAKGREQQGRLSEALAAYIDFAELGRDELISFPEDPGTRALPRVWAKGRIDLLLRHADASKRRELEQIIQQRWQQVAASNDLDAMRKFVALFGSVSAQGSRSRLALVEKLIRGELLTEAESELLILTRDAEPEIAAAALEMMARLKTKQGELEEAARCYRQLAQKYPKIPVRDGKTGEELYLELMTDKRFLPYVEEIRRGWSGSHFITPKPGTPTMQDNGMVAQLFWLEPEGDDNSAFLNRYRLGVDNGNQQVKRVDRFTGEERILFRLQGLMPTIFNNPSMRGKFRGTCYLRGNLLVFSWGHYVYAYDLRQNRPEPLWTYDLLGGSFDPQNRKPGDQPVQLIVNQRGGLDLLIANSVASRVGGLIAVEPSCVCFHVREEGLVAVDPWQVERVTLPGSQVAVTRPKRLWVKSDVPANAETFSDGELLYVVPFGRNANEPGRPYALRFTDGSRVEVPDFSALYAQKEAQLGRHLLLKEGGSNSGVAVRLYDVRTGRDVWSRGFDAQTVLLKGQKPDLVGILDGSGRLSILRTADGTELVSATVEPLPAGSSATLLWDDSQFYVLTNKPMNAEPNVRREVLPMGQFLRTLPVNGPVYAFDRDTGRKVWERVVPAQNLVLDEMDQVPILFFGSWQRMWLPRGEHYQSGSSVLVLDKRNGETIDDLPVPRDTIQLHTVRVDPRTGQVDVIGYQFKRSYVITY